MQTLKRRTSPCKYKNDPSRFLGEGITFKAKLIGILEVSEARGDKMCQDALNDLKTAIRAAGEHKQRININISIDGLRLRDEKTGDCLYHHPVHKISFIAQDMSDSRAFGYIFGSPDTGHRFFGIKTDKTASQVVISMRDLFQVVFELKKKEIEMSKQHHSASDLHHVKYGGTGYMDSHHRMSKQDENEFERGKGKYSQGAKVKSFISRSGETGTSGPESALESTKAASEAIADLLDLEQGINQANKTVSSDPFGPLSKSACPYDPFDDSFSCAAAKADSDQVSNVLNSPLPSGDHQRDPSKQSSFFTPTTFTGTTYYVPPAFSSGTGKFGADETGWFASETEGNLFDDFPNAPEAEVSIFSPTATAAASSDLTSDQDQVEIKKSPIKTNLFTELDPLGTGRVKPYVDKKDFFQELKNPPKKVLKELITDGSRIHVSHLYFPVQFSDAKGAFSVMQKHDMVSAAVDPALNSHPDQGSDPQGSKVDPFGDRDPFEETDPFREENFPTSLDFSPLFGAKSSLEGIFDERIPWSGNKLKEPQEGMRNGISPPPSPFPIIPSNALRVSLPPEKGETSLVTLGKVKSSRDTPKCSGAAVTENRAEEPQMMMALEAPFVKCKRSKEPDAREDCEGRSPYGGQKSHSPRSPTETRANGKAFVGVQVLDAMTPDPPPRAKAALFTIKPPPLPPKRAGHAAEVKPPARPPSLDDHLPHYDYLLKRDDSADQTRTSEELKCMKLKREVFSSKDQELATKFDSECGFPVRLPPPQRKASGDGARWSSGNKVASVEKAVAATTTGDGSVLDIKLTQLDDAGLENLAATLGIQPEHIYTMTLQDLTKMLVQKYSTSTYEKTAESVVNGSFEVDFDANFAKDQVAADASPTYDKYAVFKELIESEAKGAESVTSDSPRERTDESGSHGRGLEKKIGNEQDKYEALRQLSLSAAAVPGACEAGGRDVEKPENGKSPSNEAESGRVDSWEPRVKLTLGRFEGLDAESAVGETQLFPLVDQFSEEKIPQTTRDNWATFEKAEFSGCQRRRSLNQFNETENSPFSSDGKEEEREIPFRWNQSGSDTWRKRGNDMSWQYGEGDGDVDDDDDNDEDEDDHEDDEDEDDDEEDDDDGDEDDRDADESWNEYSGKESPCSEDSSRDERSPGGRCGGRAEKVPWQTRRRLPKERSDEWPIRNKWQDETEDEFESTWRRPTERKVSHDSERTAFRHGNACVACKKRCARCQNWNAHWEDSGREINCGSRRKRSESDGEFRKRCDSDASDKECIWTIRPEDQGKSGRRKKYHGLVRFFGDRTESSRESRSRHRKVQAAQKRPGSASEAKRNYEAMFAGAKGSHPGREEPGAGDLLRRRQSSRLAAEAKRRAASPATRGRRDEASVESDQKFPPSSGQRNARVEADVIGEKSRCRGKLCKSGSRHRLGGDGREGCPAGEPTPPRARDSRTNEWADTNGKAGAHRDADAFFHEHRVSPNAGDSTRRSAIDEERRPEPGYVPDPAGTPAVNAREETGEESQAKGRVQGVKGDRPDLQTSTLLRKSDSINIFSRDKDPFEGDDFFNTVT